MSDKHWTDKNHYRVVSDDGSKSWLYEADGGLFGPDTCKEVADHHDDGTTTAYEHEPGIISSLFYDGKGAEK